jgi:hypothetical protein
LFVCFMCVSMCFFYSFLMTEASSSTCISCNKTIATAALIEFSYPRASACCCGILTSVTIITTPSNATTATIAVIVIDVVVVFEVLIHRSVCLRIMINFFVFKKCYNFCTIIRQFLASMSDSSYKKLTVATTETI